MVIPGPELSKQRPFGPEKDATSGSIFPNPSAAITEPAETRRGSVLSDSSGLLRKRGEDDMRLPIALRFYFSAQIIVFSAQPPD